MILRAVGICACLLSAICMMEPVSASGNPAQGDCQRLPGQAFGVRRTGEAGVYEDSTRTPVFVHDRTIRCSEPGSDVPFSPLGLAFGLTGDLYVVDGDNSRILVLDRALEVITVFAECPEDMAGCEFIDVASDPTAGLYVSERAYGAVVVLDRWGDLVSITDAGQGIAGVGTGRPGRVYAAMSIAGTIKVADLDGDADLLEWEVSSEEEGTYPVDCATTRDGRIVVSDAATGSVLVLNAVGKPVGRLGGFDFQRPFGLAVTEQGAVLVTDSDLGVVVALAPEGGLIEVFGRDTLETPTFIASRGDGTVCVADAGKMTIEVFKFETSIRH